MQSLEGLIQINLLPADERATSASAAPSRTSMIMLFTVASVLGLMAITSVVQGLRVRALNTDIQVLQAEATELRPIIVRIDQLTSQREALLTRLGVIEELDHGRFVRVRLADELSRRLPDQVWLTSFTEHQGNIVITGVTFSNLSVADFISRLDRSTLYESVDLVVSRRGKVAEHDVVNFTVTARRQVVEAAGAEQTEG